MSDELTADLHLARQAARRSRQAVRLFFIVCILVWLSILLPSYFLVTGVWINAVLLGGLAVFLVFTGIHCIKQALPLGRKWKSSGEKIALTLLEECNTAFVNGLLCLNFALLCLAFIWWQVKTAQDFFSGFSLG